MRETTFWSWCPERAADRSRSTGLDLIHHRPFLNTDPPALAAIWNQSVPERSSVRPVLVHELDEHAFGSVLFDRAGLIVAERDGQIAGFVHAGFGPDLPVPDRPFEVNPEMGVIAMLAVAPGEGAQAIAEGLIVEAERYLRGRGAKVIYGGGQFPLNPFYWGLYSGAEASGAPSSHAEFTGALRALGYEPVSTSVHLRFDLSRSEPRDPRSPILRRQAAVEIVEDAPPANWWENIALSDFHLTLARLVARADGAEIARARTWDMTWFGRLDGRTRLGIFDVFVSPEHRRKGCARFLMAGIFRAARDHGYDDAEVQTATANEPALALYQSLGFEPVEQSTVFRLPAPFPDRSRPE